LCKTFWKKKDVKERDPKGLLKTLMPPIGLQKPNEGENTEGNLEGDQTTHLRG
jgi:hypothetical protein